MVTYVLSKVSFFILFVLKFSNIMKHSVWLVNSSSWTQCVFVMGRIMSDCIDVLFIEPFNLE